MKKLRIFTFLIFILIPLVVYSEESATVFFTCDRSGVEIALVNASRGEIYKLISGQKQTVSADGEWSAQVKSGNDRLTIVFTAMPDSENEIIVSFEYNYIVNRADVDPRIETLRIKMIELAENSASSIKIFKESLTAFPDVLLDFSEIEQIVAQLQMLAREAGEIWLFSLVSSKNGEALVLQRQLNTSLETLREQFSTLVYDNMLEMISSVMDDTKSTSRFDNGVIKLSELLTIARNNGIGDAVELIEQSLQIISDLKQQFNNRLLSQLQQILGLLDVKRPDYSQLFDDIDTIENQVNDTGSKFVELENRIKKIRNEITDHRRNARILKPHQVVRLVSYSTAAGTIAFSTAAMAAGITAFFMQQQNIDGYQIAFNSYNNASTQQQLDLYKSRMILYVTDANNWYYTGLALIPVSIILGLSGGFLFFVDYIYRKYNGITKEARYNTIIPEMGYSNDILQLGVRVKL